MTDLSDEDRSFPELPVALEERIWELSGEIEFIADEAHNYGHVKSLLCAVEDLSEPHRSHADRDEVTHRYASVIFDIVDHLTA